MKNRHRALAVLALILSAAVSVWAQPSYRNQRNMAALLSRIETQTNAFAANLDGSLDRSNIDGTRLEDEVNQYVRDFQSATDRLRDNFQNRRDVTPDVNEVLARANYINDFLARNRAQLNARRGTQLQRSWSLLRADLNTLARNYNVAWNWDRPNNYPSNNNTNSYWTGTYRLNTSRSENINTVADREAYYVRGRNNRQQVRDQIYNRLATPDQLALDVRNNYDVTIVSTTAPQITLRADGRSYNERDSRGYDNNITARLSGNQLTITAGTNGNDLNAVISSLDNGRTLQITRRIYVSETGRNVTVNSYYEKTSDVAQLDLYRSGGYNNGGTISSNNGNFVIPNDTRLVLMLNENLSTKTARVGDRFTARVSSPSQYSGATVEGYVAAVERSGRLTGRSKMTLDFENIRLRDGSTYRFAGTLESVRFANGDTVQVDNESTVREGDNQTTRTATRTGVGAVLGGIIGAIAGGGQGAAIGAAVGGAAGAGSVLAQGRDDLDLMSGTEITVRASAPANVGRASR